MIELNFVVYTPLWGLPGVVSRKMDFVEGYKFVNLYIPIFSRFLKFTEVYLFTYIG
jgi:hypothetical protein